MTVLTIILRVILCLTTIFWGVMALIVAYIQYISEEKMFLTAFAAASGVLMLAAVVSCIAGLQIDVVFAVPSGILFCVYGIANGMQDGPDYMHHHFRRFVRTAIYCVGFALL